MPLTFAQSAAAFAHPANLNESHFEKLKGKNIHIISRPCHGSEIYLPAPLLLSCAGKIFLMITHKALTDGL